MIIKNDGNVGIGETSPTSLLEVDGSFELGNDVSVSSILDEDNMAANSNVALATQQSIKVYVDNAVSAGDDGDWSTFGSHVYLTTGNVGIGTSNPSTTALEISGDITVGDDDWIGIGAGAERIVFDGGQNEIEMLGGNVGIGTATPGFMLEVNGDAQIVNGLSVGGNIYDATGTTLDIGDGTDNISLRNELYIPIAGFGKGG